MQTNGIFPAHRYSRVFERKLNPIVRPWQ